MSDPKNQASAVAPATVTVDLDDEVTFNNVTHTSLTFRKRKMRDLVAADCVKGLMKKELAVLASMADVPLPVMLDLSADDHDKVLEKTVPLMGKSWEAAKQGWLTEMAMDAGVASGIQDELERLSQTSD